LSAASATSVDPGTWLRLTKTLSGEWTRPTKSGGTFVVAYRLLSNGTALLEDWGAGGEHETVSVLHPDHASIVLTHYCAQGNQPRLRIAEASPDTFVFRFADVTNKESDQAMLVERTFHLSGGGGLDFTEVYRQPDGGNEVTTYQFTRRLKDESR
jgi:hypothetical protein